MDNLLYFDVMMLCAITAFTVILAIFLSVKLTDSHTFSLNECGYSVKYNLSNHIKFVYNKNKRSYYGVIIMDRHRIIQQAIILPIVLTLFKRDRETFKTFTFEYLYEQWFDEIIEHVQKDILTNKQHMYKEYKMHIEKTEQTKQLVTYQVVDTNGKQLLNFTPDELKARTETYMLHYLFELGGDSHGK